MLSPAPTPEDAETKALREKIALARLQRKQASVDLQQIAQLAVDSVGAPTPLPRAPGRTNKTRIMSPIPDPIIDKPKHTTATESGNTTAQYRVALIANRRARQEGLSAFKKTTQMAVETVRESKLYNREELTKYMDEHSSEEKDPSTTKAQRAKGESGAGPLGLLRA